MGIDYGRFAMANGSLPNRDPETGIRYGIISRHKLQDWVTDEAEAVYFFGCPACGNEITDDERSRMFANGDESICPGCDEEVREEDCHGDEPLGFVIDTDGVKGRIDSDGDVWIFRSPYVAEGQHASPCAPGAVTFNGKPERTSTILDPLARHDYTAPTAYVVPPEWWAPEYEYD